MNRALPRLASSRLALAGLALLLASCAPPRRQEVLSFFFDGVPGAGEAGAPAGAADGLSPLFHPEPAEALSAPAAPPVGSVHAPVFQRQCNTCHDPTSGLAPRGKDAALCDRCHQEQREREGWNHGPINLGTCIPCHRAHESPYPHLLDKPLPELCLDCHKEDLSRPSAYHSETEVEACTVCHDPHRMY
ncbi:MAG: hypothetical protein BWZ08_01202 [candidate division BRC1 bacterium ADurb.BinA292]|nr:MAG: hypothetical protein BWZ08_01202 [candidate division BRC1 bacterium ADurb.BinA292]